MNVLKQRHMIKEQNKELRKIQLLMERMDNHYTQTETDFLIENMEELDARGKTDVPTSEFFDYITTIKGGVMSTIGYISAVKLNLPQTKRKNPETNRLKNYDDWEAFANQIGVDDQIAGVIKFASYKLNWRHPRNMTDHYNAHLVAPSNEIRARYGLEPIKNREPYATTIEYGKGLNVYSGNKAELQGHSYSPQDVHGNRTGVQYFLVRANGDIIKEISEAELRPFFKKRSIDGVAQMRKLNKSDEEIAAYSKEISALKFSYANFEHSSVVYVITKINGEPKRFFNEKLTNTVCTYGFKVNPTQIMDIAKKRYKIDQEKTNFDEMGEIPDEYSNVGK